MPWREIQSISPFEDWQTSTEAIGRTVEFFRFDWRGPAVPRMLNLVGQSMDGDIFVTEKILSDDPPSIVKLVCPPFWEERAITIRCPRVWRSTLSNYVVTISAWEY